MKKFVFSHAAAGIIELTGLVLITSGIAIEIAYKADIGHIIITSGALLITGGSIWWAKIIRR